MAIKGKGRTRTRQSVRAPRRGPVPVPVPVARRRGVQVIAAFVAGLLVFLGGVWLTNGLRAQETSERDREQELLRRRAGAAWEDLVTTEVGTIGQVAEGRPPVLLPEVREVISGLAEDTPKGAADTLGTAAESAKTAMDAIEAYELSISLADKGFDQSQVLRFLSARDELLTAIEFSRQAALVGVLAVDLEGKGRRAALARAEALFADGDAALLRFQAHHTEALAAAGIIRQPTIPGA
ncbi:MAG: hypothetical protein ACR2L4_06965 [Actinomycetota bacterium]